MKSLLLLTLALGTGVAKEPPNEDAVKRDLAKLQGTWSSDLNGETHVMKITKETFSFTFEQGGEKKNVTGTFKIDPSKKPKAMDAVPSEGPAKDQTIEEIYELDGDNLKICLALPGNKRPTEFKSGEGSGRWLFSYKRAK